MGTLNNYAQAVKQMANSTKQITNESAKNNTKIYTGIVTQEYNETSSGRKKWDVQVNGNTYTMPSYGTGDISKGNMVKVVVPQGNMSTAFVLSPSGTTERTTHYLATSYSSGVTIEDGPWGVWTTDASQAVISDIKPYLWTYTSYYLSNGEPTNTDPVLTGSYGISGEPGYSYALWTSATVIVKDSNGSYAQNTITFTAKRQSGNSSIADYAGRLKVYTSTDGSTWTVQYTSSSDESSYTYTIPANIEYIKCELYLAGGTTTLLDVQSVPIVENGVDGTTIVLTNENHTFAAGTTAAVAGSTTCNIIAYKGVTQVPATIGTITGQPTGMTTSISNNGTTSAYFTVTVITSMTTANGVLTVPITVDGNNYTKNFTYSLAFTGEQGQQGNPGVKGNSVVSVEPIYYVSNSSTAPSKPSSQVTQTSTSVVNQWSLGLTPATNSYPYIYTCDQTEMTDNGTPATTWYTWSTVVYDPTLATMSKVANSEPITSIVSNGNIASAINQEAGSVTIDANKINLYGNVNIASFTNNYITVNANSPVAAAGGIGGSQVSGSNIIKTTTSSTDWLLAYFQPIIWHQGDTLHYEIDAYAASGSQTMYLELWGATSANPSTCVELGYKSLGTIGTSSVHFSGDYTLPSNVKNGTTYSYFAFGLERSGTVQVYVSTSSSITNQNGLGNLFVENSISASAIKLGGNMTVYQSLSSDTPGGTIGYGETIYENTAYGIHMVSSNNNNEVFVYDNRSGFVNKYTYGGTTYTASCVGSAGSISISGHSITIGDSSTTVIPAGTWNCYGTWNFANASVTGLSFTNLLPSANNSYNLGSSSYKWSTLYVTSISAFTANGNIIPSSSGSYNLGSTNNKWNNIYSSGTITASKISGFNATGSILPNSTTSYNLGSSSLKWNYLYVGSISAFSAGGNIIPSSNDSYNLGSSSYFWSNAYIRRVRTNNVSMMYSIRPSSDGTSEVDNVMNLGTSTYKYSTVFAHYFTGASSSSTSSDRNVKTNINYNIDDYVDILKNIKPCSFVYTNGNHGRTHLGMIAQDVEDAILEAGMTLTDFAPICIEYTYYDEEGNELIPETRIQEEEIAQIAARSEPHYNLRYGEFIPLLIAQNQKQQTKIDELEARLSALEN